MYAEDLNKLHLRCMKHHRRPQNFHLLGSSTHRHGILSLFHSSIWAYKNSCSWVACDFVGLHSLNSSDTLFHLNVRFLVSLINGFNFNKILPGNCPNQGAWCYGIIVSNFHSL